MMPPTCLLCLLSLFIIAMLKYVFKFGCKGNKKYWNHLILFQILLQPQIEELVIYHVGIILLGDEILLQQSL